MAENKCFKLTEFDSYCRILASLLFNFILLIGGMDPKPFQFTPKRGSQRGSGTYYVSSKKSSYR